MVHALLRQGYRSSLAIGLMTLLTLSATGCTSDGSSMRDAYAANLASETALNAQIMSDRAREQRCDRDPTRRECGRR